MPHVSRMMVMVAACFSQAARLASPAACGAHDAQTAARMRMMSRCMMTPVGRSSCVSLRAGCKANVRVDLRLAESVDVHLEEVVDADAVDAVGLQAGLRHRVHDRAVAHEVDLVGADPDLQ